MSDERAPLMMVRRGSFLCPYTPFDSEVLEQVAAGKVVRVRVSQPRSVPHNRLYFAMLQKVCENLDNVSAQTLHELVKLRTGYAIEIRTKTGIERVPGTIAFDKMTASEFNEFFDRAALFICDQVIPGLKSADLKREVEQMLGVAA